MIPDVISQVGHTDLPEPVVGLQYIQRSKNQFLARMLASMCGPDFIAHKPIKYKPIEKYFMNITLYVANAK